MREEGRGRGRNRGKEGGKEKGREGGASRQRDKTAYTVHACYDCTCTCKHRQHEQREMG